MVTFVLISLDLIERSLVNDDLQTDKDLCGGVSSGTGQRYALSNYSLV